MKLFPRRVRSHWLLLLAVQVSLALPALAQEEAPSPADSPIGYVFRWINFALVAGALVWAIRKFGGPYFRDAAMAIQNAIRGAAAGREAAERELNEANRQLASLDAEIQEMRRAASRESAGEAERLRALASSEADKIAKAALAEIEAAGRAAQSNRGVGQRGERVIVGHGGSRCLQTREIWMNIMLRPAERKHPARRIQPYVASLLRTRVVRGGHCAGRRR